MRKVRKGIVQAGVVLAGLLLLIASLASMSASPALAGGSASGSERSQSQASADGQGSRNSAFSPEQSQGEAAGSGETRFLLSLLGKGFYRSTKGTKMKRQAGGGASLRARRTVQEEQRRTCSDVHTLTTASTFFVPLVTS